MYSILSLRPRVDVIADFQPMMLFFMDVSSLMVDILIYGEARAFSMHVVSVADAP